MIKRFPGLVKLEVAENAWELVVEGIQSRDLGFEFFVHASACYWLHIT